MIYLDTHILVWLYSRQLSLLSKAARHALEEHTLRISPIVLLELQYLFEIDRLREGAEAVFAELKQRLGLELCDSPYSAVTTVALSVNWTRDPFDRTIVAQAELNNAPLLTRDQQIRGLYKLAFWDSAPDLR